MDLLLSAWWSSFSHRYNGQVILINKSHRVSWFIAQPLFKFYDFYDSSSSRFSAFNILLSHFHLLVFHFIPGWPLAKIIAEDVEVRGPDPDSSTHLSEGWAQVCGILTWVSSLLAFRTDFGLVSPPLCELDP